MIKKIILFSFLFTFFFSSMVAGVFYTNNYQIGDVVNIGKYNDNLNTAKTSIGYSINRELNIDNVVTVMTDTNMPDNILVRVTKNGLLTRTDPNVQLIIHNFEGGNYRCFGDPNHDWVRIKNVENYYPQWFGAKADWNGATGTINNKYFRRVVNCASLSGGGAVKIIGRFKVNSTVWTFPEDPNTFHDLNDVGVVLKNKVNLIGTGSPRNAIYSNPNMYSNSQIYNSGTGIALYIERTSMFEPGYRPLIADLTISGDDSSQDGIFIGGNEHDTYANRVYDGEIRRCIISTHGNNGITAYKCASWQIENCLILGNYGHGIYLNGDINGWNIRGNHIQGNYKCGIFANMFWGSSIIGNTIESNGAGNTNDGDETQLYIRQPHGILISGNYFEASSMYGVILEYIVRGVEFIGNFLLDIDYQFIVNDSTSETNGLIIQGNHFVNYWHTGVKLQTGGTFSNCLIGPNTFEHVAATLFRSQYLPRYEINGTLKNSTIYDDQAAPWAADTTYQVYSGCINDAGKVYMCITTGTTASSGGPTGTGSNIIDGTCHWQYVMARQYWETKYGHSRVEGDIEQTGKIQLKSLLSGNNRSFLNERAWSRVMSDSNSDDTSVQNMGMFLFFDANSYLLGHVKGNGSVVAVVSSDPNRITLTKNHSSSWNVYYEGNSVQVQNKNGIDQTGAWWSMSLDQ